MDVDGFQRPERALHPKEIVAIGLAPSHQGIRSPVGALQDRTAATDAEFRRCVLLGTAQQRMNDVRGTYLVTSLTRGR